MSPIKFGVVLLAVFALCNGYKVKPRIINGLKTSANQFPYHVQLDSVDGDTVKNCGGVLLNKNWVMTSASCVNRASVVVAQFGVKILDHSLEEGRQTKRITKKDIFVHTKYLENLWLNDIALLRIEDGVEYSEHVQAVKLPTETYSIENMEVTAMGHGYVQANKKEISPYLQWAPMQTISRDQCRKHYPSLMFRKSVICAESNQGHSTCIGDLGSPLVRSQDQVLVGISSFTKDENCDPKHPQGFTDVLAYGDFISKVTGIELRF